MEERRSIRIFCQNSFGTAMEVWIDRETGVNYLAVKFGTGGGICPLIDGNGKPIVTK